ncbi:hypothetical protein KFK09_011410 [Dendrobium nobile]|uniref:Pentatricopeptide repeat-containing protein n=1 Tax=Dendrobium nobile TaxID=94219 RepID=A0A8T3BFP5_DENNO|nr:hypothetical protein KFK09_011410 [Dendrobium nobile]
MLSSASYSNLCDSKSVLSPPSSPHYSSLLQLCQSPKELAQVHSLLIKSSFLNTTFALNSLIRSYSAVGNPITSLHLFSQLTRDAVMVPDKFTLTFVFNACSRCSTFFHFGKQVHTLMVKSPNKFPTQSWNSLMNFYQKAGVHPTQLSFILYSMKNPDVVSWNCLLDGYVKLGDMESARKVFDEMPSRDVVSWTSMLVGFASANLIDEARQLFYEMPRRNIVSWSAMIGACMTAKEYSEALALFREMEFMGVGVDKIMFTQLLSACAGLGAIEQGRWIHAQIDKRHIQIDSHLCTSLVDMYAKCGQIDEAYNIFKGFNDKKVFLWNSMLGGLAMHSKGKEVMNLFYEMCESGIKPNEITFICVLSACSHSGLVDEGLRSFGRMKRDHGISPTIEHYVCVVDLLGRAGLIDEAKKFIEDMPMPANGDVWRALLSACKLHGKVKLGGEVEKMLLELEPFDHGNYVLLSNLYAKVSRWKDAARMRRLMKDKGVRKIPGCSSIEVHGTVHEFVAGDQSHPLNLQIYEVLNELTNQIFERDGHINL